MSLVNRLRNAWCWRQREWQLKSFAAALKQQRLDRPFVLIAMPGSLHVTWLALQRVPAGVDRLIVLNGLPAWEVKLAQQLFAGQPLVHCGAMMEHDQVLDLLFEGLSGDFGILDYDCFVLDPAHFAPMRQLAPGVLMNAVFSRVHPHSGLRVPETFFLFFNRDAIRSLGQRHGVSCHPMRWRDLKPAVAEVLGREGFSDTLLPEVHKDYFDTLRVLMMLGRAEGLRVDFLADFPASPTPSGEIFHVGGISNPRQVDGLWRFRGVYFWRRALEVCELPALKARYQREYGDGTAAQLRQAHPAWAAEVSEEFFAFCDRLLTSGMLSAPRR